MNDLDQRSIDLILTETCERFLQTRLEPLSESQRVSATPSFLFSHYPDLLTPCHRFPLPPAMRRPHPLRRRLGPPTKKISPSKLAQAQTQGYQCMSEL
jgi:hypothetical protein